MRNSEENSGLHLIKKHKKTLLRAVFSRAGLIVLLLLLQIALIALAFSRLRVFLPHFVTVMTIFSAAMAMYLLNSRHDPSAKLTWIVVILVLPIFGALLYAYTRSDIGHRLLKRRFWQIAFLPIGTGAFSRKNHKGAGGYLPAGALKTLFYFRSCAAFSGS